MMETLELTHWKKYLIEFAKERDWEQFHTPKNLAAALSVEASELLEIFQWLTEEESFKAKNDPVLREKIGDEIADVLVYMIRLATRLEINIPQALELKMKKNALKYPTDLCRGSIRKYTELKHPAKQ